MRVPHVRRPPLAGLSPGRRPPRVPGDAPGHAVQPAGQRRPPADRGGLPGQNKEGGLEGVLRVLVMAQHAPADPHDQRAVAPHQRGEGGLVAGGAKAVQQVGVGRRSGVAGRRQLADLSHRGGQRGRGHEFKSSSGGST